MLPGHWFTFGKNSAYDDGLRAMRSGDFETAIELFLKACKESKDHSIVKLAESSIVQCCRKLASSQIEQGNGTAAIKTIQIALQIRTVFADLHFLNARAWFLEGNLTEVQGALESAIKLNPKYTAALQFSDTISYTAELDIEPEVLAFIRDELRNGNRAVALKAFDKATFTSEVEIRKKIVTAQSFAENSDWNSASAAWQEIIDERPNYPDIRCQFGQVLLELDRVEEALEQFEQAVAINPIMADAYALLGITQKRLGLHREAGESFEAARKLNPHHPIADMETLRR